MTDAERREAMTVLDLRFREQQYREQLRYFSEKVKGLPDAKADAALVTAFDAIMEAIEAETADMFAPEATRRSDFFRDLLASRYHPIAEEVARERG